MPPPFLFRIDEVEETKNAVLHTDSQGRWMPSTDAGANKKVVGAGVTGLWWYCDKQRIYKIPGDQPPTGASHFKTQTIFYSGGQGFWCLNADATNLPSPDYWEGFHVLKFNHSTTDYSSYLTNTGSKPTLRVQRADQRWPSQLLPDIYHTTQRTTAQQYGGLRGDLPLFIALIALSTNRNSVETILPQILSGGVWKTHNRPVPRTHQRGVVVTVYTCPSSWAEGSSAVDLEAYEEGVSEKYFD